MFVSAPDQLAVADAEADAPAGHRIALRHREELDGDVARAVDLEDARRRLSVVHQIRVREIGDHPQRFALGQRDDLLEEREIDDGAGRVVREVHDQALGLARRARERLFDLGVRVAARSGRDRHRLAAGDADAEAVNRITGVGRQHAVAGADDRQQQVGEAFLRAQRDDRFAVGVEALSVFARVPVADRLARLRHPARGHVALVARRLRLLDQAFDRGARAGAVGIAEAEVVDVVARRAQPRLQLVDGREHVGRQRGEALEAVVGFRRLAGHRERARHYLIGCGGSRSRAPDNDAWLNECSVIEEAMRAAGPDLEPAQSVGHDRGRVPGGRARGEAGGVRGPHPPDPGEERQPGRRLHVQRQPLPRLLPRLRLLLRAAVARVPELRRGDRLRSQDRRQAEGRRAAARGLRQEELAQGDGRVQRRHRLLPAARGVVPADARVPRGLRRAREPGRDHHQVGADRARRRRADRARARRLGVRHGEHSVLGSGARAGDRAVRRDAGAAAARHRDAGAGRARRSA